MMMNIFEKFLIDQQMSQKTIYEYIRVVTRFSKWYEETKGIVFSEDQIQKQDPHEYVAYLRYIRKLSPRSINKIQAALRKYLQYLQRRSLWPHEINLPDIPIQKKAIAPRRKREPYEISSILRAIELEKNSFLRARDRCMLYFELFLGIRIGECMDLLIQDVILTPGKQKIIIRDGKGGKYDEIHIRENRKTLRAIDDWLSERAKSKFASSEYFFISFRSGKVSRGSVEKMVYRIRKRSHIDDFNTHDLRHTFVSEFLKASKDLRLTMDAARHAHVSTTVLYTHPSQQEVNLFLKSIEDKY